VRLDRLGWLVWWALLDGPLGGGEGKPSRRKKSNPHHLTAARLKGSEIHHVENVRSLNFLKGGHQTRGKKPVVKLQGIFPSY